MYPTTENKHNTSYSLDEKLIAAVFKREPLWNPASELHKNSVVLKRLWNEIANELRKESTTLKTRWKNLRAYFIKLHRKFESPINQTPTITWQFYDQLSFLRNADREASRSDYDDTSSTLDNTPLDEAIDDHDKANSESDSNSVISQAYQWKRRRIATSMQRNELLEELERKKIEAFESESVQERNDDLQFFESLLPYVKNIPLLQKLKLRCKIQEMILNELEICENNALEQHLHYEEVSVGNLQYPAEPNVLHLIKNEPGL